MANIKNGLAKSNGAAPSAVPNQFAMLTKNPSVVSRFATTFNGDSKKAEKYLSSALSLYNSSPELKRCEPNSIMAGIGQAALLNLPLNQSFGCAYLVPMGNKAQFIVGYKGYIRMMMNSNMYKSIVMVPVREGEITNWNKFTETYETGEAKSDAIVGFFARFELRNGFAKALYMTKEEVDAHAKKFSKGGFGWKNHYEAMGIKTVFLKIVKFAPMTEELQMALESDSKIMEKVAEDGTPEFVDIDIEADSGVVYTADTGDNDVDVPVDELFKEQ